MGQLDRAFRFGQSLGRLRLFGEGAGQGRMVVGPARLQRDGAPRERQGFVLVAQGQLGVRQIRVRRRIFRVQLHRPLQALLHAGQPVVGS